MFNDFNLSDEEVIHIIDRYTNLINSKSYIKERFDEDLQQEIKIFIFKILTKNRKK